MSVVRDVGGWFLDQVPLVGELLGDTLKDNLWADMRKRLTVQEVDTFTEVNRWYPGTLALLATYKRVPERGQP